MSAIDDVITETQVVIEKTNETSLAAGVLGERITEALKLVTEAGIDYAVQGMTQAQDMVEKREAQLSAAGQTAEEIQAVAEASRTGGT